MRKECDFSNGKYHKHCSAGSNVVVLGPEIATIFSSSEAVKLRVSGAFSIVRVKQLVELLSC